MTCTAAGEKAAHEEEGLGGLTQGQPQRRAKPPGRSSLRAELRVRAEVLQAALPQAGKAAASPFDHQQREQEETLPAPTEPGLSEVNLRSDAPRTAVPPDGELPLIISADRIGVQQSNYQSSFSARKLSEHFQRPCSFLKSNYQPTGFSSPFPSFHPLAHQPVSSPKPSAAEALGRSRQAFSQGFLLGTSPPPRSAWMTPSAYVLVGHVPVGPLPERHHLPHDDAVAPDVAG